MPKLNPEVKQMRKDIRHYEYLLREQQNTIFNLQESLKKRTIFLGGIVHSCLTFHKLYPRDQRILEMRLGLLDGITHTLEEVSQEFGVTRERIRDIEQRALFRLKEPLN